LRAAGERGLAGSGDELVIAHYLRLIATFIRINIQTSLAYRADAAINILLNFMWLAWELLSLSIIFSHTSTLGGWGPGELIALLGVFRLVNTMMMALIWPNTEDFNARVRDGSLDYLLLQPVNSMFLVSFSRITVWRVWDLVLAVILIAVGIRMAGDVATPASILAFVLLAVSGAVVIYSLWIVLIALTFWFTKFDNNVTILQALLDAGRYPVSVYPAWLRVILTFLIPIAVATTVPLQALRSDLGPAQLALYLAVGAASLVIASRVWKAGVKRYSGASS
jgi:ABC-2 type transport system permease protein